MAHQYLRTTTAILAAIGLAACSSDGRVSFGAGSGVGTASAPSGAGSGSGSGSASNDTAGGASGVDSGQSASDGGSQQAAAGGTTSRLADNVDQALSDNSGAGATTLASVGNVGDLLTQSGENGPIGNLLNESGVTESADNVIDPLGRVSVGEETLIGSGDSGDRQSIGVSALAESQNYGDEASIGVLSNGQVLTVDPEFAENSQGDDLIGVMADNDQIVGSGGETVGVSVLSSPGDSGQAASAGVLSGDTIVDVQVNDTAGENVDLPIVGQVTDGALTGALPDLGGALPGLSGAN
jgi:hypothetical protein